MAGISDEVVRQEVRRILEGANLDSISERKIKDQIAEKHGHIERFKDVIREEVETFLESVEVQEKEEVVKSPATKRKAAVKADSKPPAKVQKKAPASGKAAAVKHESAADEDEDEAEDGDGGEDEDEAEGSNGLPIKLSSNRRADLSEYKGKTFVNIREYYEKDGELLPGKKGISLSPEQFDTLRESASSIQTALASEDTDFKVALSTRRCVRINVFKGTAMVDIREMYEKDGEEHPGKKGISLNTEQWIALKKGLNKLNSAM